MLFGVCIDHKYDWIMFIAIRLLVFALSMNMIGSCLLQNGYSCKLENNCCSVYMNKTFYGHTPNKIVCWISIVVIHIFIKLKPKDAKLIMIVQLICGIVV